MALVSRVDARPSGAVADLPQPSSGGKAALLGAVLALALGLRLWGLNWGLPWAFHPDEVAYADRAREMLRTGDPNPGYFMNPSSLTYLIAGELLVARALGRLAGPLAPQLPGSANLLARLDSALLGTASVALLAAVGTILFGRRTGLMAALLLAVSFLHVRDSHYGVSDVPSVTLLLLALYFDARLLRRPAVRWYVLAGLAGGLATSTKYNMGFFVAPLLAADWLSIRRGDGATGRQGEDSPVAPPSRRLLALGLAGLSSLAGYLVGTPYTVLDFGTFEVDFLAQYGFGNVRWSGQPPLPVPSLYLTSLLQGFGALPLTFALVGLVLAWRRQRAETILISAFPAAYLAFLLPKALFFPRFALPLVPFCCLWAAYAATELARRLRPIAQSHWTRRLYRTAGLVALLAATLAQPLTNDLLHNRILMETDTRILANEWVQTNLPRGSRLKLEDYSLRDLSSDSLIYTANTAKLRIELLAGDRDIEQPLEELAHEAQYVVTSSFVYGRDRLDPVQSGPSMPGPDYRLLHRRLEAQAELAARFSPGVGGREVPFRLDDVLTPFWSLEEYQRPGPTLRIYSLMPLAADRR